MPGSVNTTIDGKPVLYSGSLVIPPGRVGALVFGMSTYILHFEKGVGGPTFRSNAGMLGGTFHFTGFDNALGTHVEVTGLYTDGVAVKMALVIYGIGDSNIARVVHYTVFPA